MATKRVMASAVNWTAIGERVPEAQKVFFNSLKSKSDGYLRRVVTNPEAAPKLDWAVYKAKVSPALVESMQKQYEAFKVPYPADKWSSEVDAQEKAWGPEVTKFVSESNARIKEYEVKIAKWDDILPFEEMTLEDYRDAFPDKAMDPINRPTLWPHGEEEEAFVQSNLKKIAAGKSIYHD